jgi:hypothetical protein
MRLRYNKRIIRPFILSTVREKKRKKTKEESERPKEDPRDKI